MKVKRHSREQMHANRVVRRGVVQQGSPLVVELLDSGVVLDESEEDVEVTQSVVSYHAQHGLDEGDNVMLSHDGDGWVAVDVLSDKSVASPGPLAPLAAARAAPAVVSATVAFAGVRIGARDRESVEVQFDEALAADAVFVAGFSQSLPFGVSMKTEAASDMTAVVFFENQGNPVTLPAGSIRVVAV